MLVYDVNKQETFHQINSYYEEYLTHCDLDNPVAVLIGNKSDLKQWDDNQTTQLAHSFAEEHGMEFYETSARTGSNVNEAFYSLVRGQVFFFVTRDIVKLTTYKTSRFGGEEIYEFDLDT
eukprot:TRINITY_DN15405_c0_g1_i10.p1 TRINITY_DN15405_c0_g1~~TRINITY_DN15405_c0_g1_i10.p1  ORF type:complete len:120 (-),score=25.22 TRINITY_DN15405_c0_g1_i10:415-774(-)